MAFKEDTESNFKGIKSMKEVLEYAEVALAFKPYDYFIKKCDDCSKNFNIMSEKVDGEVKKLQMVKQESEKLKASLSDYDPKFINPELKLRFKDPNVSVEKKLDIIKRDKDLMEEAIRVAKDAASPESYRSQIKFAIKTTGVRFLKSENPNNLECVLYNEKDKITKTLCLKKEPKSEVMRQIWEGLKCIHTQEENL